MDDTLPAISTVSQNGFRWNNPFYSTTKVSLKVLNFESKELKVNDLDKTPQFSGALSIAQFDLAKFLESIGHPLPAMAPGSLSKVELVSRLQGTPHHGSLVGRAMLHDVDQR